MHALDTVLRTLFCSISNALLPAWTSTFSISLAMNSIISFVRKLSRIDINTYSNVDKTKSSTSTAIESNNESLRHIAIVPIIFKPPARIIKAFRIGSKRGTVPLPPLLELPGGGYQCSVM
jgi:hypothetical protein